MILLPEQLLAERRRAVEGPLEPLFHSLSSELAPLVGAPIDLPRHKALLSRAGGRCENDGATLVFDPASPDEHRCRTCGAIHTGESHHRAWITNYQLWLVERAVQGALLHVLHGDARHAALARDVLHAYAERYTQYPNRDNVLGPSRLFFSTYLESVWLLNLCVAADGLFRGGDAETAELVRDRIVAPARELIATYDEGMSNRQVWNNAALLASAALLRDMTAFDRAVDGESGVVAHLGRALLGDGTWYEGENYHQFALRGLWYCVTLCDALGRALPTDLVARFDRAFAAPFLSALPDLTMPSRKDSQYAVSLRQWRMAELAELGFARTRDPALGAALRRLYQPGMKRIEGDRASSTADIERNGPASGLTRADLGWRALLHALPELPPLPEAQPRSVFLEEQGLAVFRRAPDIYVALDYGESGGGHGHPDRLNVLLSRGPVRWLDDLGTGSYLDASLHWYRSTLAHNAPLLNGASQPRRDGVLLAHDEREGLGWIVAAFEVPGSGAHLERSIVVAPDYMVDELRWRARDDVRLELPMHLDVSTTSREWNDALLDGGAALEDGFRFAGNARSLLVPANILQTVVAGARAPGAPSSAPSERLMWSFVADHDLELFCAEAPGQPSIAKRAFALLRTSGSEGVIRSVLAWNAAVEDVSVHGDHIVVATVEGAHRHWRDERGWHVEMLAGAAHSTVDLAGWRAAVRPSPTAPTAPPAPPVAPTTSPPRALRRALRRQAGERIMFTLGEEHYRRSELSWRDAGSPAATITFDAHGAYLRVTARVCAGDLKFAAAMDPNPYDNEHPDTLAAGVQFYLRTPDGGGAWMLVPEPDSNRVRVRSIPEWGSLAAPTATWQPVDGGYELCADLALTVSPSNSEYPVDVDVIVSETTVDRERRRGQLVMSGARGEFVYLRGDRHDTARLIPIVIVP